MSQIPLGPGTPSPSSHQIPPHTALAVKACLLGGKTATKDISLHLGLISLHLVVGIGCIDAARPLQPSACSRHE